jgi:hypothetical protein
MLRRLGRPFQARSSEGTCSACRSRIAMVVTSLLRLANTAPERRGAELCGQPLVGRAAARPELLALVAHQEAQAALVGAGRDAQDAVAAVSSSLVGQGLHPLQIENWHVLCHLPSTFVSMRSEPW